VLRALARSTSIGRPLEPLQRHTQHARLPRPRRSPAAFIFLQCQADPVVQCPCPPWVPCAHTERALPPRPQLQRHRAASSAMHPPATRPTNFLPHPFLSRLLSSTKRSALHPGQDHHAVLDVDDEPLVSVPRLSPVRQPRKQLPQWCPSDKF
jgi:hypothetical protein